MTEQTTAKGSRHTERAGARPGVEAPPRRKRCAERTQREILNAAAWRFARAGYASVTLKEIAADAGVTAALVVRYFGSKHDLFRAVVSDSSPARVDEVLVGTLDTLGHRLAGYTVGGWLNPEEVLAPIAALRSLDVEDAKSLLSSTLESRFTNPLAAVLPGPSPQVRAKVIVSLMLAQLMFALGALFEPEGGLAGADNIDEITRLYGLAIQACITVE